MEKPKEYEGKKEVKDDTIKKKQSKTKQSLFDLLFFL